MAIVKRFNRLLGLEKIDVLVDEKDKSRHIIISDMPESLPQGKSSFLIEVSPYMRKGIELQIDFIDSKGNSIYVEPVSNYLEGTSRTVSLEVYNTVAPGVATMIIVGELESIPLDAGNFSDTQEVPDDFKGVYNVRLTKEVIINTAEINVQPIKFYSSPRLTAVEKRFGSMEREVVSGETTSSAFSIIGRPTQQEEFSIFESNESEVDALGAGVTEIDEVPRPPDGNIKGDKADIERLKRSSKKRSVRTNSRFKRSKRIRRRRSPEEYPYRFTIKDSNHEFTTEEIGGEIKFSNIVNIYDSRQLDEAGLDSSVSFNVVSDTNDENFPTHYTASIAKLENNKTAFVNTPFTKQDKEGNYRLLPMEATAKVHYTKEPTASYSVTNIVSYADVTLSHLRTFSGEVFKAKVYVKAEGSQDDYKLLAEVPVESPELMIDTNSVGIGERTGVIISDLDLNTNWEKFGGTNGLSVATSTTTASFDNSGSLDSVMISGSISSFTDQIRFQQKDAYKFNLTKGIDYDLSFNAVGEKGTDGRALLMVYVSGSSLNQSKELHHDEKEGLDIIEPSQYGKRMGVLEVEAGDDVKKKFGLIRHNFNSDSTGDAKVQFRIISGKWNLFDISVVPSTDTGFSPSFVNFQQELPPELTHKRPEKLEFLTEFYDINNNLADEIAVTTGSTFTGGNMVITGDDNVLSHNMFIGGDTTGSGIHMGGTSSTLPDDNYSEGATGSGFIRSIGYLGFESASNAALGGKKGFMIYSGSVLPNSGEDYKGVGLELVGASGSLKFRTSPSVFDVQADSFFVGKTNTQFISGSGEKIEISSSNFHLDNAGNVDMTGTITAQAGNIGGFNIEDSKLTAGIGNSAVTMSGADQLFRFGSGSQFDTTAVDGILFGKDTDGKYKFAVGKGDSYIVFDGTAVNIRSEDINVTASVFSIDVDVFKLSSNNLFISSSDGGFISAGNPRPSGITGTSKGIFINGRDPSDTKPKFLVGAADGNRISFDGDNIFMSSSGFFLGSSAQFVSGSDGNIEISSSNFHLDNSGNVIMSGKVTANEGSIGGFNITNDALSSANFLISGSSTGNNFFISSSNFNVKASGDVTASALDLTGGAVGGLTVAEGEISVGSVLKLKDSGQITGSSVLFTGGKIGGFTIDADEIKSTNVLIDSANEKITLGSANAIKLQGGGTDNFIAMGSKSTFSNEGTGTAGIIIGMDGTNPQAEFVKNSTNYFIFDDGIDIQTDTLVASGSSITLETPKFFLGKKSTQFVSGSNGNIEISSSQFHLTKEGNVTGSAILLGNKGAGQFLQFVNNTLTVQGAITADSIAVPSAAPTPSSSISSGGLLTTVSASIGGFDITSAEIKDKDNNLRLKSSGQITGSKVLFNGGTIGGFTIDADEIKSGTNIALDSTNKKLTINNATFGNEGIQLEFNSGTPRLYVGDGSNEFVKYDGSSVDIRTKKLNASGSNITLETPKFFLGKKSNQFVSGSNGNIEISSSNFHLTPQGNVTMSGEITAAGGTIGGFTIGDELTSTAGTLILRGASGRITASNALITGDINANTITANTAGTIANFNINSTEIASSNNKLRLKANGQITASEAQITGKITATSGQIAGFTINGTKLQQGTSFNLDGNASADFFISSSDFQVTPSGDVSGSKVLFTGGTIGGWTLTSDRLNSLDDNFRISSAGSITIKNHSFGQSGFQVIENSGTTQFYVGNGSTRFIKFDGSNVDIGTEKLTASGSSINLGAPSFRLGSASNFISGSGGSLVIQNTGTTILSGSNVRIETPRFFFGKASSQFISGSDEKIEISSSKFHLKNNGDVIMNNITASNANVSGKMTATSGEIGGFTIGDDLSNSAGSTLKLKGSSGQITASAAQITGDITANTITANTAGTIANFQINSTEIKSANQNLRLKANGQITASAAQITGKITATSGQIAGFSISGNTLTATNFTLDASGKRITLGTGNNIFIADGDEGIQLGHATFASAPFSVTRAGLVKATSGTIGGWTLSGTQISSNNLIMDSAGVIQTSDYASNVKGWRLSPANGGEAEFQNVKIRGTLSTAVFEKETVNAVGGQLYIANSTAITGSATIAATAATMSVANVGGFVANEVLSAKKVSATGFATEYMLVQSASRDFPSSETDFRGKLFVVRGYNSGSTGDSGSLGDVANISQSFEPGQVIVSTGKIGTGFIRLNANPNDVTTPYIDIVERTGSGVYDVDLKARLGDLSGLSSGLLYGNASPGFGLFTENVFLQGAITATTGSFTGKVHVGTTNGIVIDGNAKKLFQGTGTHNNQNTGFYMDSTGKFSLGDKLVWDSSTETLTITGTINITDGSGFATAASVSGSFPSATSVSASLNASSSALQTNINAVEANVSGAFTSTSASIATKIMTDASGKIVQTPSTSGLSGLILKSTHLGFASSGTFKAFIGNTGNFLFKNDDDNLISFGQSTSVGDGTTTSNLVIKAANAYLSGSSINLLTSRFFFGDSSNFISGSGGNLKIFSTGDTTLSGSSVTIETPKFFLGKKGSQFVSGSNNQIEISSSKFHLNNDGNVIMNQITASDANVSGKITADSIVANTTGSIAGFTINSEEIRSSNNNLRLKASGNLTASNYLFNGNGVITGSVTIGTSATILGSLSAGSIATPSSGPPFKSEINSQGFARFTSASIAGWDIDSTSIASVDDKVIIDSSNKRITINNTSFGSAGIQLDYNSGTPRFFAGSATKFVKFDGSNVDIVTEKLTASGSSINLGAPSFKLGSSSNFISGSGGDLVIQTTGTTTLSGSAINIQTPKFYLGQGTSQFISGSDGNIEISSSAFHLDPANNTMVISGSITATTGKIGGMLLENNKLKSQYGDGSVITKIVTVEGSTKYYIDGVQQPTLELKVGNTYRFDNSHSSNGGHPFRFATSADGTTYSTGVTVVGSEGSGGTAYVQIVVTASTPTTLYYKCNSHGNMGGQLNIITIGTLELNGVSGQITGSDVLISGGKISGSNLEINVPNVTMSGSAVTIETPKFFLGKKGSQFVSGSNNLIEISSSKFHLKNDGNVVMNQITASNAKISGDITITSGDLSGVTADTISGSVDAVSSSLAGRQTPFETQVVLSSGGMSLNKADGTSLAEYGTITRIGLAAQEHISASSDGITIKDGATQLGKFTAGGATLGATAGAHISASTTDVNVIYDANNKAVLDSNSLDITVGGNQVATFGANPIITGGTVTVRNHTNNNDKVVISENKMEIFDNNNAVATFAANTVIEGGTITLRNTTNNNDKVVISQDKFQVFDNNTDVASFGAVTRIGDVANEHISASSAGITIKDGSTVRGTFVAGGVTIGNTSQGHVSMSTADVSIKKDANNFARIDSDSFDIILNGQTTASFGGTTTIGSTVGRHLKLTGTALEIKTDANTTALSASAAGLEMSGKVKATSGEIGGFTIGDDLSNSAGGSDALKLKGATGQITGSKVLFDGGKIGGFSINQRSIVGGGGTIFIDEPTQTISVGSGTTAFAQANRIHLTNESGNTGFSVGTELQFVNSALKISGSSVTLNTPTFFLGDSTNFISGSNGNLKIFSTGDTTLSGSSVDIQTPKFFLGKHGSQFLSGSNNQIEISSSAFHLDPSNNTMLISGSITATDGNIGGFTIGSNEFTRDKIFQDPEGAFLTSSIEIKTGTGFAALPTLQVGMKSGSAGAGVVMVAKGAGSDAGAELRLGQMSNGVVQRQIYMTANTGSTGTTSTIQTSGMTYGDSSDSGFYLEHSDANGDRFQIGSTAGAHLKFSSNDNLLYMSSSNFFLGGGGQFISGSNRNIEISSSNFHLSPLGNLTASNANFETVTIRGGTAANDVSSDSNQSFVGGGTFNLIQQSSFNSVIGAGAHNLINLGSDFSSILSGVSCSIDSHSDRSFIGAGSGSKIISSSNHSFVGTGINNTIKFASSSFIGAGIDNTIEGTLGNTTAPDPLDISISLGNFSSRDSGIVSGRENKILNARTSFIGGGTENIISGSTQLVDFSSTDYLSDSPGFSVIVGGSENKIKNLSYGAFIGGGYNNEIRRDGPVSNLLQYNIFSAIVGGSNNKITNSNSDSSFPMGFGFIGGGSSNWLSGSLYSTIVGGASHRINQDSKYNFIGGGNANYIGSSTTENDYCFIGGGRFNEITGNGGDYSVIVGGDDNTITGTGDWNFIGGGEDNVISSTGNFNAILGGEANTIGSSYTDTFIIGSGITANASNTTFVEGLNASGNITVGGTVDGIDIAGSLNQAVKTTSSPTFAAVTITGDIDLNGNLVGDDATDITNIESIYADHLRSDADGANNYINLDDNDFSFIINGSEVASFEDNTINLNDGGNNVDVRMEAQSGQGGAVDKANLFKLDAGLGIICIGNSAQDTDASRLFQVTGNSATDIVRIFNDGNNENRSGMQIRLGTDNGSGTNEYIMFRRGDETAIGLISATSGVVSYGTFTGVHNASILESDSASANVITGMPSSSQYHEYPQGTVVSMVSSSYDGSLQPVSFVVSSSAYQDKRAFGVYLGSHNWDDDQKSHAIDKHLIMSVGDGYVMVCNQNGNIETGDYITTASGSGGYGCKQSDDLLHNYTVAKACDSVDWSNESTTYKLLACTYHCG